MLKTQEQTESQIWEMKCTLLNEGVKVVEQPKGTFPRFIVANPNARLQEKAFFTVMTKGKERQEWHFCNEGGFSLWWH